MKLWISNLAPGTSDEEIKELVKRYEPELICTGIERVKGTGSRPGAMLEFTAAGAGGLDKLSQRLNGIYWKNRSLLCQKIGL